ncbi:MAG TPA: sulfur carrier protein ThiS [Chthonomonas sp.]|jgi:sulfur carrier protein|uniref:sulfur carrier protein ThiS n=1 Tax=Chthonomonas sp. TaxID=2282153 RepID=UPI002B4B6969|nr:sulfur carrier protein ThiS [Chthonomonas sp.]HLH79558.1 sulfur carrier protein ThiS [Chthonomonas sp.]HLI47078.1 sulfur carrier protein ThiS [Chthonomonas sp.]
MVYVNGEPRQAAGKTLEELLKELQLNPQLVAVLVNETVYPRGKLPTEPLKEGDVVEIVTLMQGG